MKLLLFVLLLTQDPSTNVHTDCIITQGTPEIVIFSASPFAQTEINQPNNFFVQKPNNATVDALYCGDEMEHWFDPAPKEILPL